ncbi:MAG TPA: hypothetical protein VM692_07625, partial [Gammaproteobacteria bacterium]|nr:hypothetical protein [Gammaproteobacteria bacterium]
ARVRWAVFAALATALVVSSTTLAGSNAAELVPVPAAILWIAGIAALVAARWRLRDALPAVLERAAQVGLVLTAVYVGALVAASAAARSEVRSVAAQRGIAAEDVMVAPTPANPFRGDVIVMTAEEYYVGRFDWLGAPRVTLDGEPVPRPRGPVYERASLDPNARRFLLWARYPAIEMETLPSGGTRVRFTDVRYRAADRLSGPVVELPPGRARLD